MISALAAALLLTGGAAAQRVEIVGMDYAFRVPITVSSGPTTFRFVNNGKQRHELNIALLKRTVSLPQFMAALNAGKPVKDFIDSPIGVLFAGPGERSPSGLFADLQPGREYAVICIFKDDEKAPKHHQIGMFSLIKPVAATSSAEVTKVDTIIGADYAFTKVPAFAPGRHLIRFVNAGKQRHEFALARLKPGVTLKQLMEVDDKGGDVETLFDQDLGLLHGFGGVTPAGMLDVELVAGRQYVFECGFQDTDKSPPHYKMGMFGAFVVKAKPGGR